MILSECPLSGYGWLTAPPALLNILCMLHETVPLLSEHINGLIFGRALHAGVLQDLTLEGDPCRDRCLIE